MLDHINRIALIVFCWCSCSYWWTSCALDVFRQRLLLLFYVLPYVIFRVCFLSLSRVTLTIWPCVIYRNVISRVVFCYFAGFFNRYLGLSRYISPCVVPRVALRDVACTHTGILRFACSPTDSRYRSRVVTCLPVPLPPCNVAVLCVTLCWLAWHRFVINRAACRGFPTHMKSSLSVP